MKGADIAIGRDYRAWPFTQSQFAPKPIRVTIVAKRGGEVDAILREPTKQYSWGGDAMEPGDKLTIPNRNVVALWTAEDDDARERGRQARARCDAIERRLIEAGIPDGFSVGVIDARLSLEALEALLDAVASAKTRREDAR